MMSSTDRFRLAFSIRMPRRGFWTALALLLVTLTTACSVGRQPLDFRRENLQKEILRTGLEPQELILPDELTPEMKNWVRKAVPITGEARDRLEALLDAMLQEGENLLGAEFLGVNYASGYTGTAEEVFDSREANCLAFTHLYVSLAREIGLDAYFMDVYQAERFERDKDLIILSGHVTAAHGVPTRPLVLEYSVGPNVDYRYVERIGDVTALSMYYSNRGAEELQRGRLPEAVEWLRTAVTLDPQLADAWVNYGVALRRQGENRSAEEAYRKALAVDPRELSAYQNLRTLLRIEEREAEAADLDAVIEQLGDRNPYNYLNLGDMNLRQGLVEEAEDFYRKALRLYPDFSEPYAALGILAYHLNDRGDAERWLKRAQRKDAENPRVQALDKRLYPDRYREQSMARFLTVDEPAKPELPEPSAGAEGEGVDEGLNDGPGSAPESGSDGALDSELESAAPDSDGVRDRR
ncbi:MAG: tetratricopeptide repeat protein [Acidobacteriota bacterium]